MNKAILSGRICTDIELKTTSYDVISAAANLGFSPAPADDDLPF